MAYHFYSIPVSGSPNVEELNQLLDHAKVASVKREFVADAKSKTRTRAISITGSK